MTADSPLPLEQLLAQSDWVTMLARALVTDAATADDIAQATWIDVLRSPPRSVVDPRAWLAAIVRRKALRSLRTDARRSRREQVATAPHRGDTAPSAADLAARVATHRELVDAVLALDEPYRETVVLRFFENLDLEAIAQRTQSKHNTVRSRLQRGLQHLRERLDRAPGGRERWLPAVLLLSRRRLAEGATVGGVAGGIALAITMKKLVFGAVALAAGLLFTLPMLWPDAPGPGPGQASNVGPITAGGPAANTPATAADQPVGASLQRTAAPGGNVEAVRPPRQLVDRDGQPLANVTVRSQSPFAVKWQGGDRGWISGPDQSLQIPAAEEERLRSDPGLAQQFFARFEHAEEWRATVLGTPLPAREVTSADDGSFTFAADLDAGDPTITVSDPAYVLITAGAMGTRPWIAGPATRITATVRDSDGKPLADTFAMPLCPTADGALELHAQLEARTDDNGNVLIRKALAHGLLRVRHPGFETAFVPTGPGPVQHLDIVLRRRVAGPAPQLDGLVVDGGGLPIAGAAVWFGRRQTTTDKDGRFVLPADGPQPQYALTIVAKGYAALQVDNLGAALVLPDATTQDLLFVMNRRPLAARGLVLDSNGSPLAGALVGLLDPTLLDISFESIEARVGGWRGGVATAADGTFSLGGLGERSYRFRAIDPATGAMVTSAPLRADQGDLVLRLPLDVRRNVRGQVTNAGLGIANASVEIGYCTHITKGGGTQFDNAPAVVCDAQGQFVLPVVPRQGAWLCVRIGTSLRSMIPVEALPADGELVLTMDQQRWLQLVGSESPGPRPIHFELADGGMAPTETMLAANGDAPVLPIPTDAVAVVIDLGRPNARRLQLTDDRAVLLRVR